jgi:hypothetical protein
VYHGVSPLGDCFPSWLSYPIDHDLGGHWNEGRRFCSPNSHPKFVVAGLSPKFCCTNSAKFLLIDSLNWTYLPSFSPFDPFSAQVGRLLPLQWHLLSEHRRLFAELGPCGDGGEVKGQGSESGGIAGYLQKLALFRGKPWENIAKIKVLENSGKIMRQIHLDAEVPLGV